MNHVAEVKWVFVVSKCERICIFGAKLAYIGVPDCSEHVDPIFNGFFHQFKTKFHHDMVFTIQDFLYCKILFGDFFILGDLDVDDSF